MDKRLAGVACALALSVGVVAAGEAAAQQKVRWKLASSYASTLDVLGQNITRLIENIKVMSDGNFDIRFHEPGALVPALEVFDAVSKGSVEMSYSSPGFHAGRIPHLVFFASVPFGPSVNEYVAWIQQGGGYALYDRELAKHNIKGFQCGIVIAESSGWFRKEIKTLDDLKGLKMRFFGLGAKVMQKFGVNTQLLAAGDIYPALERGVLDATEFSYPSLDKNLGFYQIAKHNYFPGWHQQASFVDVIINLDAWNKLPKAYQKMVEVACNDANLWLMAAGEARQGDAIAFHQQHGVQIHTWPNEFLDAFKKAWEEVAEAEAAADPRFKEIWDHYKAFRANYARWREIGYLK
ncbi:MAG: TRAP transporter substrate-binding protein [Geminicoccaceae bacterium]|nr:TRAP transporter substrate-binding protein [Geminicoccaceae bacterium]MDW8370622.1 TRAP transporter substrate-binding protein [Geminicoccaceae bacterium]